MKRLLLIVSLVFLSGCGTTQSTPAAPLFSPVKQSAVRPDHYMPAPPPQNQTATPTQKHIDQQGLTLIENFENSYKTEYCVEYDSYGHVYDRGFGETEGIIRTSPCITWKAANYNLYYLLVNRYEWAVRALGVPFNQHQWDALDSFAWNLGAGIFTGSLRTSIQHYNPWPMLAYDHAGGVELPGLRARRLAEIHLFLTPEPKPTPKHSRAWLVAQINAIRHLRLVHHCAVPPKYGGGKWHKPCVFWTHQGAQYNHELKEL